MLRHRFLIMVFFLVATVMMSAQHLRAGEPGSRHAQAPDESLEILTPQGVTRCPFADDPSDVGDPATTSALPGAGSFVAQEHFNEGVASQARVKIAWLGAMFRRRFLSMVEANDWGATLRRFVVRRAARDAEIIAALTIHHETKLVDLWCLLSRQPNGEPGPLLTNAVPNVFYIRDTGGDLGAVDAVWGGTGWEIGASAVDTDSRWRAGRQVLAR
jgi:hypothetical protein